MKSRTLTCLFVVLAIPIELAAQQQQKKQLPQYTVTDLGTLGGMFSDTGGVNNQSEAVGESIVIGDTAIHAFLWNKG